MIIFLNLHVALMELIIFMLSPSKIVISLSDRAWLLLVNVHLLTVAVLILTFGLNHRLPISAFALSFCIRCRDEISVIITILVSTHESCCLFVTTTVHLEALFLLLLLSA